jgi:hypothetical protein
MLDRTHIANHLANCVANHFVADHLADRFSHDVEPFDCAHGFPHNLIANHLANRVPCGSVVRCTG